MIRPRSSFLFSSGLLLACWLLLCTAAQAANLTISSNTSWNAISSGSGSGGRPSASDTITVTNNATLTVNSTNA